MGELVLSEKETVSEQWKEKLLQTKLINSNGRKNLQKLAGM